MTKMVTTNGSKKYTAKELAEMTDIPLPTVTRILKMLSNAELLESQRGPQGGYSLIKNSEEISIGEVIEAMEGPIALSECNNDGCDCTYDCTVGKPWQKINEVINRALADINLSEMSIDGQNQRIVDMADAGGAR